MNKTELIMWLQSEQREWLSLLGQIDESSLEKPGVNGNWSIKDLIAHLTTWHQDHLLCLDAAAKDIPVPDPPWPIEITDTDEINAWIFTHNQKRQLGDVLEENRQVFEALLAIVKSFPESIKIDVVNDYRIVRFGQQQFSVGYFFDHYHEDHETQIREWLAKFDD